jgi:hypothetical protein
LGQALIFNDIWAETLQDLENNLNFCDRSFHQKRKLPHGTEVQDVIRKDNVSSVVANHLSLFIFSSFFISWIYSYLRFT